LLSRLCCASIEHAALTRRRDHEKRPQKITLGEMRSSGVRGVLIYCADYHCSHSIAIIGDRWPDDTRLLTDLEPRFACSACGKRGADVRLDWQSAERPEAR